VTASPARDFVDAATAVIMAIPAGEVMTYGEIAAEAGYPGAARAVGNVLAGCGDVMPWWRVVAASGRLVPGHEREHARRLRKEGVALNGARTRVLMRATRPREA
jgi:methylated-DNA-protein-cysteine methyltransferase related protein